MLVQGPLRPFDGAVELRPCVGNRNHSLEKKMGRARLWLRHWGIGGGCGHPEDPEFLGAVPHSAVQCFRVPGGLSVRMHVGTQAGGPRHPLPPLLHGHVSAGYGGALIGLDGEWGGHV